MSQLQPSLASYKLLASCLYAEHLEKVKKHRRLALTGAAYAEGTGCGTAVPAARWPGGE